jgi:glycosyltransferase involved in cell wall biosynthesis
MDDGSTDSTAEIIRSYTDLRIRYELCPHDFVGTVNRGFNKARGKYIALFDHDDIMVPHRLQKQFDFMESHPDIVACGGWMKEFGASTKEWKSVTEYREIIIEFIERVKIYLCNPTVFIRKASINKYNIRYKNGYGYAADIKFWFDLIKIGKVTNLPEILVWYRTSETQTSKLTASESQKSAEVIFYELVDYLLSKLDDKEEIKPLLIHKLMPAMKKLNEYSLFSNRIYFFFMREIIEGLYKNGFLNIEEPLGL